MLALTVPYQAKCVEEVKEKGLRSGGEERSFIPQRGGFVRLIWTSQIHKSSRPDEKIVIFVATRSDVQPDVVSTFGQDQP